LAQGMLRIAVDGCNRLRTNPPVNEVTEVAQPVEGETVVEALVCQGSIGFDREQTAQPFMLSRVFFRIPFSSVSSELNRNNTSGSTPRALASAMIASNEGRFSPRSIWPRYFGFSPHFQFEPYSRNFGSSPSSIFIRV
jgi:hypothetical protein